MLRIVEPDDRRVRWRRMLRSVSRRSEAAAWRHAASGSAWSPSRSAIALGVVDARAGHDRRIRGSRNAYETSTMRLTTR